MTHNIIAHDTINDIALVQVGERFYVRYGLSVEMCSGIAHAHRQFTSSVRHALECAGLFDDKENTV